MTSTPKIRGDKLVLATISVLRTLIMELDKAGAVDISAVIAAIDDTVIAHRETGDPNKLVVLQQGAERRMNRIVAWHRQSDQRVNS
jgi:hypothetical protein